MQSARADLDKLIGRIGARRSTEAMAQLYREASPSVYAFSLSLLKNAHDAEDVLQDCFVQVFLSAGEYVSQGKPMAWILTIARNLCMSRLRERRASAYLPQESWEQILGEEPQASVEEMLLVRRAVQALSDEERQIVLLHALAGFRHREIAEFLRMPLPTVLSKYSRAMKKLRERIGKENGQHEQSREQANRKADPQGVFEYSA
ncbi:MAG: RNA polymerase sigma factor [Clostridia bacterium]|nr:RNA polymerase sigma factor [Clostridia bacterium]